MFQKELSDKIVATYPSKNYGRLSILTNYRLNTVKKFNISANCFRPKPKVESSVIHFRPRKNFKTKIQNIDYLEKNHQFVFFSKKRKIIRKSLLRLLIIQKLI